MYLIKRDGSSEHLDMNKVRNRIEFLCDTSKTKEIKERYRQFDLSSLSKLDKINVDEFEIKIVSIIYNNMKTSELDKFASIEASSKCVIHPQYEDLAVRLSIGNIQKNLVQLLGYENLYLNSCRALVANKDDEGNDAPLLRPEIIEFVEKYHTQIEELINYSRDYNYTYHGVSLLEKGYLAKSLINGSRQTVELPQHMWMRVAISIWVSNTNEVNWDDVVENITNTYNICSSGLATHATPTLFNAGRTNQQLSSCVLMGYMDDSIDGIFDYYKRKAKAIKYGCGVGTYCHNIRAQGSYIKGTDGKSNGIVPFLRISNGISEAVDQGGGKRAGAEANYIELWHADIEKILDLKLPTGNPKLRAQELFYALWSCDEFVRCLLKEQELLDKGIKEQLWYLMCPKQSTNLYNKCDEVFREAYIDDDELDNLEGFEFTKLYRNYIQEGKYIKKISAIELFTKICHVTSETSGPYRTFKDTANRLSNHKHLGTIKSSNLCAEIYQYTDPNEIAVCNLASVCLNRFVFNDNFDFDKLAQVVYQLTLNLDRLIDISFYPLDEMRNSNLKHRPMGIGVQGLADTFSAMGYKFGSNEALELDFKIFETIYYSSLKASCHLAKTYGVYESYYGSPISNGLLQIDLCKNAFADSDLEAKYNPIKFKLNCDWDTLRADIKQYGVRHSLRTCCMPTGSTSTIMGNSPSIEPHNAMIYKRTDSTGEKIKYNRMLIEQLIDMGLWNNDVLCEISESPIGSIQDTLSIPQEIKDIFVCAWDDGILRSIMNHATVRNPFIDQGQSMNLFIKDLNPKILSQVFVYAWRRQLKTGSYYIRTLSNIESKKTTKSVSEPLIKKEVLKEVKMECNEDVCVLCQS